ncbi:hypothetical protein [Pseudomonas sp. ZB1P45]|uniref:hypothetical protein n=1 Tax=Pseudomonas frigoris TaxID=3398356 RepID=UPI0039EDFA55
MILYNEMAVMTLEMMTEFDQPVTTRATTVDEYDPNTGTALPDTIYQADPSRHSDRLNSLIKQGDKEMKFAAQGLEWAPDLLNTIGCASLCLKIRRIHLPWLARQTQRG